MRTLAWVVGWFIFIGGPRGLSLTRFGGFLFG